MPPTRATTKKSSSVLVAAGAGAAQIAVSILNDASKNVASSPPKTVASSSKKKSSQSRISPRGRNNSPPTEKNEKKRKRGESATTSATSAKAHASSSTAPSESDLKVTGRPKRRAASSVRFGSYKDIEKVDFSLLVDSVMEVSNKSYYASASKKQSAGTRKATTQTSSKKKKTGQVKRSRLMASSTQSMTKAAVFSENTTSHKFKHATTNSTIHGGKINLNHVLPPILIEACNGGVTPGMLRSLSSSTKIDIFDRKTGRIMKGEDGVTVKDLTQALRNHAEYEPIIPSPHLSKTNNCYREARTSSKNARVSKDIQPQTKIRDSKVQGRNVIVTGGPHKGLYGKIDGCLPGNWYLVANALKEDELNLDMVIHSKNLKLVSKRRIETEQNTSSSLPASIKQSDDLASKSPIMNLMQSLKVQMLELEKGKKHLEMMASQKSLDTKDKMQENAPQHTGDIIKALANASNALEGAQAELQKKSFLCEILDLSVKKNDR